MAHLKDGILDVMKPERDAVVTVWFERHSIKGFGVAEALARAVPSSGVGWVDLEWRSPYPVGSGHQRMQRERLLADWSGQTTAQIARAVIQLADGWLRERVVAKLAEPGRPQVESVPNQGPVVVPPPPALEDTIRAMQRVMQQQAPVKSADYEDDALTQLWRVVRQQMLESAPPDGGQGRVESGLPALTWGAGGGTPEHASNGLGYAGDYIAEPEVGR